MCDLHPKVSGNQILYLDFGQLTELRMFGIQITKSSKFQILDLLYNSKNKKELSYQNELTKIA